MGTSTLAQGDTYVNGSGGGGSGTVTSVTFTGDGTVLSSTPSSAVTTSGTVAASLKTQTANTVLAGPTTGAAANPTFRALVSADYPANTVANGSLAQMAAVTIKGNNTGSTANAADLTPTQAQGVLFPSAAYASLPAASSNTNAIAFATDVGSSGIYVQSDGTRWKPLNGNACLYQSNTPFVLTGTTTETLIATINFPAGLLGANDSMTLQYAFTNTTSANNKQLHFKNGATNIVIITSTTNTATDGINVIRALNSQTSQNMTLGILPYVTNSSGFAGISFNAAAAFSFTVTGSLANTADTMTVIALSLVLVST